MSQQSRRQKPAVKVVKLSRRSETPAMARSLNRTLSGVALFMPLLRRLHLVGWIPRRRAVPEVPIVHMASRYSSHRTYKTDYLTRGSPRA